MNQQIKMKWVYQSRVNLNPECNNKLIVLLLMRKINKRLTLDSNQNEAQGKLPNINQSQFSNKLNDLLDKISVQNRYASRISQTNMKNLTQLQKARAQLKKIAQDKKLEQLNAADTNEIIQQMSHKVKDSETELEKLFKEIIQARKEIKNLKKVIVDLHNQNLQLQKQVLQEKREKFSQICQARQQMEANTLDNHIAKFLLESDRPNTFLYRFCYSVHKNSKYDSFLEELDRLLQKQMKQKSHIKSQQGANSRLKLKFGRRELGNNSNQIYQRYKTEHCDRVSSKQSGQL